jgi:hypothetical protein
MKGYSSEAPGFRTWSSYDGYVAPGYFVSPVDHTPFVRIDFAQNIQIFSCPSSEQVVDTAQLKVLADRLNSAKRGRLRTADWLQEYFALYTPYLMSRVESLRHGDLDASRVQIFSWLDADLWCMHSGYLRSIVYRCLGRIPLSADDGRIVAGILVNTLLKGRRIENRSFAKRLAKYNPETFELVLASLRSIEDEQTELVVSWLVGVVRCGDAADCT